MGRSRLFSETEMPSDSASAMFVHASDTMPIPKRRRANNLNSHFDRMVQTMNMRCHSPPRRRRIRSTGSSSVTSSEYMPKTPLDDYDGLGEGHIGPDFSVLRKRRRDESLGMASSSTSKAVPDPLPEWLANTVGALPASNPLRMLVPTTPDATEIEHSEDEDNGYFRFNIQASDPAPHTMESTSYAPQVTAFVPFTTPGPPPPPPPRLHTPRYLASSPPRTSSARPTSLPFVSHHTPHPPAPMLSSSPPPRTEELYTMVPQTSTHSLHLNSSSSPTPLNELRRQLSSPSEFGSLFTTPGPGYVSSRPMYYDSPTEPPEAASSPVPIDSWSPNDIDASELDFQWTPYDRRKDNFFNTQRPAPKMLFDDIQSECNTQTDVPRSQNAGTPGPLWPDALHEGLLHDAFSRDDELPDFPGPTLASTLAHASPAASRNARHPAFPAMFQHHSAIISHKLLQQSQLTQRSPGSQSLATSSPSRILPSLPTAPMSAMPPSLIPTNVPPPPPRLLLEHSNSPLPPRPPSQSLSDDGTRFRFAPPCTPPQARLQDQSQKMDVLRSPAEVRPPVTDVGSPHASDSHPSDVHPMAKGQPLAANTPSPGDPTNASPTVNDQTSLPLQQGHYSSVNAHDTSPQVRQSQDPSPPKPKSERASPPPTPRTATQIEYGHLATPAVARPPLVHPRTSKFKPAGVSKQVHPQEPSLPRQSTPMPSQRVQLSLKPLQRRESLIEKLDQLTNDTDETVKVKQERDVVQDSKDRVEERNLAGSNEEEKAAEEVDELQSSQVSGDSIESWSFK